MKNTLRYLSFLLLLVGSLPAAHAGRWYMGLQVGQSTSDYTAQDLNLDLPPSAIPLGPAATKNNEEGFGGRLYAGNEWNPYFALEMGLTGYESATIDNIFGIPGADAEITPAAIDLVGKVIAPINDKFNIYAKFGGALVVVETEFNRPAKALGMVGKVKTKNSTEETLRPTYGLGGTYVLSDKYTTDISWTRIQGGNGTESMTLGAIALTRYFG